MKTTKLAFSVYALTLVLMTNGAMAAGGSANPSCTANTFTLYYLVNADGCPGYFKGDETLGEEQVLETWGAQLKVKTAEQTGWYQECIGAELTGWSSDALAISSLDPYAQYTNDLTVWKNAPKADGTTSVELNSIWTPTISNITLNANGGVSSVPTEIYRRGIELNLCNDWESDQQCAEAMTPGETGLKDYYNGKLPVRAGYSFRGFFQSKSRADAVGKDGYGTYTDSYCKTADASKWTTSTSEYALNCPWITSSGYVSNENIGVAAAVLDTNELFAAWAPKPFFIAVDMNARGSTGDMSLPLEQDIEGIPDLDDTSCLYDQDNSCGVLTAVPTTTNDLYKFNGYNVIVDGVPKGTITASMLANGYDISNVVKQFNLEGYISKDDGSGMPNTFTLKAQWTRDYVTVNFYATTSASEPFYTANARFGGTGDDVNTVTLYKDGSTMTKAPTMDDIPASQRPADATLRAFAVKSPNAPIQAVGFIVNTDTTSLPVSNYSAGNTMHLVSNANGTIGVGSSSDLARALFDATSENVVSVYGTWAQNCVGQEQLTANHVGTCQLVIGDSGSVNYVVTCDTGYNIGGADSVNTDKLK